MQGRGVDGFEPSSNYQAGTVEGQKNLGDNSNIEGNLGLMFLLLSGEKFGCAN